MAFKNTRTPNKPSANKPGASKPRPGKPGTTRPGGKLRPGKAEAKHAPVKSPKPARTPRSTKEQESPEDNYCLVGRNAVLEAITHGKPVDKILLKKDGLEGSLRMIAAKARERKIVVLEVDKARLELLAEGANHQGVIALCPPKEYAQIEDILNLAHQRGEAPFVVVLDGVTDPYNLGAVIRTAEASGAHGVIIPKRRAAGITPVAVKASAGAASHVLVARVSNITTTIADLKKQGLWIAAANYGASPMYNQDLTGPLAIVVGSEGEGVSRLVRENCDFTLSIPMLGVITSLNASVAAGIIMYEVVRQRKG